MRTLPAMAADVLSRDLGLTPEALAALTGAFPAAFALAMVPVGVGLDRWGVRRTALVLLAIGGFGCVLAALAAGRWACCVAQCVLGIGCAGALMCPMTYAARAMDGAASRSGPASSRPSAIPACCCRQPARAAGGMAGLAGRLLGLGRRWRCFAFVAVAATVRQPPPMRQGHRSLWQDAREILAIAASPARCGALMVIAFASFAVVLGVRGLWGGPWLMEAKGLPRVQAGNVLLLVAMALVAGPALAGVVQRWVGRPVALLAGSHLVVAGLVFLLLARRAGRLALGAFGLPVLPAAFDATVMVGFGLVISFQILVFSQVRAAVPPEQTGRALSANNIAFFGGAAVLQAVSGVAAGWGGIGAALATFAVALVVCTLGFLWLRRRA